MENRSVIARNYGWGLGVNIEVQYEGVFQSDGAILSTDWGGGYMNLHDLQFTEEKAPCNFIVSSFQKQNTSYNITIIIIIIIYSYFTNKNV
jgi:hypothetical protein